MDQQHDLMVLFVYIGHDLMNQNPHNPLLQSHVAGWRIPNCRQILCEAHQDFFIRYRNRTIPGIKRLQSVFEFTRLLESRVPTELQFGGNQAILRVHSFVSPCR